jgi:MFS family permease
MRGSYRGTYVEALASVARSRNLRLAQLSSLSAWTGEFLFITTTTVYAFDNGGAAGVGLIGFLRVLPATLALPLFGALADRMSRRRLLVLTVALRTLTAAGAAAAAAAGLTVLGYVLITVSTVAHSAYRPLLGALLPTLCTAPDELASSNAVRSILDGLAALVGPLVAALLLAEFDAAAAFVAVAVLAALSGLLASGLRYESVKSTAATRRAGVIAEVTDGVRELRAHPRAALIVWVGAAQCVVRGALTVFAVTIAVDLVGMGRPGVGVLWAAFGVGGLVAAIAAIGAAGSNRLGTVFGVGVAMWGLPIAVCGLLVSDYVAVAAFAIVGAANALVDVSAFTLWQRIVPDHVLARLLAFAEAAFALAMAVGSLIAPPVISGLGNKGALIATGCVLPVLAALSYAALRRIDADIRVRTDRIRLLRRVGMLRLLPVPAIESLALNLRHALVPAGVDVFRKGDPGDDFYVIETGRVEIVDDGQRVRELGPGESFGEIALLRSVPRTVSVRAVDDLACAVISGARFVGAVTGFSATSSDADALVRDYLAADAGRRAGEQV